MGWRAEETPLALPHRERRNPLPDYPGIGRLDIVIASAENEALVQLVREADIVAQPSRPGAGHFLLDSEQLAADGELVVHRAQRRPPGEAELDPSDLRPQGRVGVSAIEGRAAVR